MSEDEGISISDLPLETQWQLYELSQRRADIGEEAFADGVAAALDIPREMLDKAVVLIEAGPREEVEAGLIEFDEAYGLASTRN